MKRREWTFEKPAHELREAASERTAYHTEREAWWDEEREKADEAIRSGGFKMRSHAVTGGERHEVVIDPTLTNRLAECETKIRQHRAKTDEYAQWIKALDSAGSRSFTLDHEDWIFFFGLIEKFGEALRKAGLVDA